MSYRKAWLLVEEMNRMFAKPLVAARPGGAKGGGAELTAAGAKVVALYRAAERKMRMGAGRNRAHGAGAGAARLNARPLEVMAARFSLRFVLRRS